MFALNVRRVARSEWLLRLPADPFLPVIWQILAIELNECTEIGTPRQPFLLRFSSYPKGFVLVVAWRRASQLLSIGMSYTCDSSHRGV
jgi:hypothetical protein